MSKESPVQEIDVTRVDEPQYPMRTEMPRDKIFELAEDIKKNGLINPITVRPVGDRYEVVAGHCRLLAHRYGNIPVIRCIVRELNDDEAFAIMTSENLQREDVNPVDEALHVKNLLNRCNGEIGRTATLCGRSKEWVESRLQIADMPSNLQNALRVGEVGIGVALALARIADDTDRDACLQMAISQGASAVMARYWVAQWEAGLFGHGTVQSLPNPDDPNAPRTEVMLKCAIDGKEYPARDMVSVLVHRDNEGYIYALREQLQRDAQQADVPSGENEVEPVPENKEEEEK